MKITTRRLKKMIAEEMRKIMNERGERIKRSGDEYGGSIEMGRGEAGPAEIHSMFFNIDPDRGLDWMIEVTTPEGQETEFTGSEKSGDRGALAVDHLIKRGPQAAMGFAKHWSARLLEQGFDISAEDIADFIEEYGNDRDAFDIQIAAAGGDGRYKSETAESALDNSPAWG